MPKKVVIITYYWPPSGGSGVQRWAYFAKYLKEIGDWEPIVVTVDPKHASYPVIDESLIDLTTGIKTVRTKSFDLLRAYSLLKSGKSRQHIPQGSIGNQNKKSLLDRLSLHIRANYFIPDARKGWNKYAIKAVKQIISDQDIDLVITTGPPHSTHLVGLELKKQYDLKWVADFRDPWREVYYNELFNRSKRADRKDEQLEKKVLESADFVTTVGPSLRELLSKKITNKENKVEVFYNGFDHELLEKVPKKKYNSFTIAQVGVFTDKQPYKSYLKFLTRLSNRITFNLELAGNVSAPIIEEINKIENINLIFHGKVSHAKAISIMKSSHLLTNCLPLTKEAKLIISGKLMEYISTGNPILIIGKKDGDAAKLVREKQVGKVFTPNEVDGMVDFAMTVNDKMGEKIDVDYTIQFTRENVSKSLSSFLNQL